MLLLDADGLTPVPPDRRVEASSLPLSPSEWSGKGSYK